MSLSAELLQERGEAGFLTGLITSRYELEVPPGIPIVLNDINGLLKPGVNPESVDQAMKILIGTTFKPEEAFYIVAGSLKNETQQLISDLLTTRPLWRTAVIYPGEGARSVLRETPIDSSKLDAIDSFFVPTKRVFENGKMIRVEVSIPDELAIRIDTRKYTDILVIDDVIASGSTLYTLRVKLWSYPGMRFQAVSWFCRRPTCVDGYESVQSVYRYWTREGWPALNSLSTLLRTDEKGEAVREGYTKKYIRYPYGFRKQIQYIRSLTTIGGAS